MGGGKGGEKEKGVEEEGRGRNLKRRRRAE